MTSIRDGSGGARETARPHWTSLPASAESPILGRSPAMRRVAELFQRIGSSGATVLLRGETGTGKDRLARALHRQGPGAAQPFVKVDCAALPEALLESELFGYEKGAFTGAFCRKPGRIEAAAGGTLFIDEVGELPVATQAKLLRLLQEREFERLGGQGTVRVDLRIIAATHQDLETMIDRGHFRQDLFYRLNVMPLWLPPLRARRDDIEDLALHFLAEAAQRYNKSAIQIDAGALRCLRAQRWPGNVRQLQNIVERLVVLCDASSITEGDVRRTLDEPVKFSTEAEPQESPPAGESTPNARSASACAPPDGYLSEVVRDAERQAFLQALAQAGGNRTAAARLLGVSRSTFYSKLEKYGLR